MLKFSPTLYPPLITDERPYPVLLLSEDWTILHANQPAVQAGLTPGTSAAFLLPPGTKPVSPVLRTPAMIRWLRRRTARYFPCRECRGIHCSMPNMSIH